MFFAHFLKLPEHSTLSLRDQICELISTGIANNHFPAGDALPSCRGLSTHLGVSRNTVHEAYCRLIDIGLVESRDRSGYRVCQHAYDKWQDDVESRSDVASIPSPLLARLPREERPSTMRKVDHPADWRDFPYPFVYNQIDAKLFPLRDWRESVRVAMRTSALGNWSNDAGESDSSNLVRQLQQRLLAYRGISAAPDEILITSGAQNAIFLLGVLNGKMGGCVALEDPCYPEARNAFSLSGNRIHGVPVDEEGLVLEEIPSEVGMVYATPSHQFPTTVTLSRERREALISLASRNQFLICEDDYEAEMNFVKGRERPIRALDQSGRVVYVGSLSKCVAPGLRLGYMVAHPDIINEAKAIRRTIMRHPPGLLQEAMAGFIGSGFLDAHLRRMEKRFRSRWETTLDAMNRYLPEYRIQASGGGTSIWVTSPHELDSHALARRLRERGVLIDEGGIFFNDPARGRRSFRLGFAALSKTVINDGIRIIADEVQRQEKALKGNCPL